VAATCDRSRVQHSHVPADPNSGGTRPLTVDVLAESDARAFAAVKHGATVRPAAGELGGLVMRVLGSWLRVSATVVGAFGLWAAPAGAVGLPSAFGLMSAGPQFDLRGCVESVYGAMVPTAKARPLVPARYSLVGELAPVTPLVVRTSRCSTITVDTRTSDAGALAQIGLVIVPPDGTGNVNLYQLWYYTDVATLADTLRDARVPAQFVANLAYNYTSCGNAVSCPFWVNVPWPGDPTFAVAGSVTASDVSTGPFTANWWQDRAGSTIKMQSSAPNVHQGVSDLAVHTDPASGLGRLIGGSTAGSDVLKQFNLLGSDHITVTIACAAVILAVASSCRA
jgi:hypothetical protein